MVKQNKNEHWCYENTACWFRQKGIKKKWLSLKYAFMLKQNKKHESWCY